MKRLLVVPLLLVAAVGMVTLSPWARSQSPDDFGVLKTTPATAPGSAGKAMPTLPPGVVPARTNTTADTAPPNPYPLPAEAGAWLICAAAYTGSDGAELARQVCVHLRTEKKLQAHIYNRGAEERRQQDEEHKRRQQAMPGVPLRRKTVRISDHFAVMIAGWPDFASASKFLPVVKKYDCPKLTLENGNPAYETMIYSEPDPKTKQLVAKRGRINPFHNAMVTRNPAAPNTMAEKPKFDPFWAKLNADEEYSLLQSKGKYTLVVKEYSGARVIQSRGSSTPSEGSGGFLSAMGLGDTKPGEGLDGAAAQAHELAKFLRHKSLGFKAYVLHMRQSSAVTVGEFSGPEDPEIQKVIRQLAAMRFKTQQQDDPIGLLPQPLLFEVPRP